MDSLALNSSSPANAPGGIPEPEQTDLLLGLHSFKQTPYAELAADSGDDTDTEFNWLTEDSVVVESQPAIAVFRNRRGHVVIRSEATAYDAEDSFLFLGTETALKALIASLQRELKAGGLRP